jgi:ferredoxin/biotin operon repressor
MSTNKLDPIYKELAAKLGQGNSKHVPQILAKLANLEQAKIVRELPTPSEEIAKRLNLDKAAVDRHIQELIEKGLVFPTKKGPQMARNIEQLHDAALGNPKFDEQLGGEYFDLFAEFMDKEILDPMVKTYVSGDVPKWRIIPRWKSIKDIPGVLPSEDIREVIKSQEILALLHCPCKREHRNRKCGVPVQVCINVGRTAQYNINRGAGKKISAAEALQVIEETDKFPMVHFSLNQAEINQLVCNCHWCCCAPLGHMFRQDKYKITDGVAKSRFEAVVDPQKCKGCKTCLTKCQFGAAQIKYYPEIGAERATIDLERCMGCGSCVVSCGNGARSMKMVRPPEHIPQKAERLY